MEERDDKTHLSSRPQRQTNYQVSLLWAEALQPTLGAYVVISVNKSHGNQSPESVRSATGSLTTKPLVA